MSDGTASRTCSVCGGPIRRDNQLGICEKTPQCRTAKEGIYRARKPPPQQRRLRECKVEGCHRVSKCHDMCSMHAQRTARLGSPGEVGSRRERIQVRQGDVFGRWTALEDYDGKDGRLACRCECGSEQRVAVRALTTGASKSCGCSRNRTPKRRDKAAGPYVAAGDTFNRLTAIEDAWSCHDRIRFRCECGSEPVMTAKSAHNGHSRSCGCLRSETFMTHGLSGHPLLGTWRGIESRTGNPSDRHYADYGGRGISLHPAWRGMPDGFSVFAAWIEANLGPRPRGMTLDRIDNDKGYEPGNLRWATSSAQVRNRRSVKSLTAQRDALLSLALTSPDLAERAKAIVG